MRKNITTSILIMLVILLTGCGGKAAAGRPSTKLIVDMNEFMFEPTSYTIPAGQEITIDLKNSGAVEHDFTIMKKGIEIKGSFDPEKYANDMVFHATLPTMQSGTFTFTAPTEPGEYQVICGIVGHFQAGMIGSLTVVAAP